MKIATREQQILRVQEASFHPQMNEELEKQIRVDVVTTVQSTIEAALVEELLSASNKMLMQPR